MNYQHTFIKITILLNMLISNSVYVTPCSTTINDFSRLNKTTINSLVTPTSYQELQAIIHCAQKNNLKIAISGIRHSQGGHAFFPNAIVISMAKLNNIIDFDPTHNLLTVQAGATWDQIQKFLQPCGYAVQIMQFANPFTIGGSLSVNCNGCDPHFGPFIESVQSIKILLPNASIITASRSENKELFALAIGGYGLFGIILEATINVVPDNIYQRTTTKTSLERYIKDIEKITDDNNVGYHFAFLNLQPYRKKLFGDVVYFNFNRLDDTKFSHKKNKSFRTLKKERFVKVKKVGTKAWSRSKLFKTLHWVPEGIKHNNIVSRNNIMRPPAGHLYIETKGETNLLQEYFIPVNNLIPFIQYLEMITQKLNINLMHVAFRFIRKNTENYLPYTTTDRIGIVLFFNQKMTVKDNQKTQEWTQYLIEKATKLNGTYYLPIQLHATKQQALTAYPNLNTFFALKRKYDPSELFMNHFYEKYAKA